jgi:hypothetical protein
LPALPFDQPNTPRNAGGRRRHQQLKDEEWAHLSIIAWVRQFFGALRQLGIDSPHQRSTGEDSLLSILSMFLTESSG